MALAIHRTSVRSSLNKRHAQYVVATLGLLIDVVGKSSLLGTLLRQTQNEVLSLLAAEEPRRQAA